MTELRRAWGPNAITRWTLLVTMVMVILVGLPAFAEVPEYTLGKRVLIAFASAVPALGLLVVARITWLSPLAGGTRGWRAVATFAATGALAGATRGWIIDAAGITNPIPPGWRIPATALAGLIWLPAVAIVVDHVRVHRATMRTLRAQRAVLDDLDRRERYELDVLAREFRGAALRPVREVLARIAAELAHLNAGGSAADAASRVEAAVAGTIRPLSHEILSAPPGQGLVPGAPGQPDARRERARRLVEAASRRVTHAPWLVSAIPVILFPLLAGPRWGVPFLVTNALVTWVALALMLMAMRHVMEPMLGRLAVAPALALLVAGYLATMAVVIAITMALGPLSPLDVGYQWVGLITITPFLIAASFLEAASMLSTDDERDLRAVIADIGWSLARIRQRVHHDQQILGSLLHGSVQGALAGVARSLESVDAGTAPEERRRIVDDALARLAQVEALLDAPPDDDQSFSDALDGVLMLWRGVLTVEVDVPANARDALDRAPSTRRTAVDVVAEALGNAVRHGRAGHATITIAREDDVLTLVVRDDGSGGVMPARDATPGMGSRLFDEASPEWSLTRHGTGSCLALRIPLETRVPWGAP